MTLEEKMARIRKMRPIDDVFFEVLAKNKAVCQEILQVIMQDRNLVVEDVIVQSSERNLYGRSVRLDALCTLGTGVKCNIEVQRADNDDHLRRVRYNASVITTRESNPGEHFGDILELYMVYISSFDFLGGKKTIYHVDKVLRETGKIIDDGVHEIFVNTAIDDGSEIADLMACFMKEDIQDERFPNLSNEAYRLKHTEGGLKAVSRIMDEIRQEAKEEGRAEGHAEGRAEGLAEGRIQNIATLLANGGTEDDAKRLLNATPQELEQAKKK